ncbi:MAG: 50S ribosomal protein L4 [Elusimicrobia bacterium RIFCSPLOWO2_01_FULL_64_13]|nr:MAG: 50S ribosomal protein L4 [Elusimicrobia bacterium RIFCSPHIGHO2_01_FULL_64_10]OGR95426.1 MAG: 50S ribosomal protein L4 [Elusimicrobia bacterium RIFCSPLOWO2_01_FULL_64_13]
MTEIDILNRGGVVSGKADLPEIFNQPKVNPHLVHEVVTAYLANQRRGTHSTLSRGEVRGGGKKPWKQKHTGRARSGTSRSPLWRGGSIIFGPKPRSYRQDLPRKKVQAALAQALTSKARAGDVVVAEGPELETAKTKKVAEWLKKISCPPNSLFVVVHGDPKLTLASRNLPDFQVAESRSLHAFHVLNAGKVILTPEAVKTL